MSSQGDRKTYCDVHTGTEKGRVGGVCPQSPYIPFGTCCYSSCCSPRSPPDPLTNLAAYPPATQLFLGLGVQPASLLHTPPVPFFTPPPLHSLFVHDPGPCGLRSHLFGCAPVGGLLHSGVQIGAGTACPGVVCANRDSSSSYSPVKVLEPLSWGHSQSCPVLVMFWNPDIQIWLAHLWLCVLRLALNLSGSTKGIRTWALLALKQLQAGGGPSS